MRYLHKMRALLLFFSLPALYPMRTTKKKCTYVLFGNVLCGKQVLDLNRHVREVHRGVKPYQCTECNKAFSRSNQLSNHIGRHRGNRPFVCSECPQRFVTKDDRKKHVDTMHEGLRPHQCPWCDKFFSTSSARNHHLRTVHYGLRNYTCHICSNDFTSKTELTEHIEAIHQGIKHLCPTCYLPFKRKRNLTKHQNQGRCPGKPVQPKKSACRCPHCRQGFSRRSSMIRHIVKRRCPNLSHRK